MRPSQPSSASTIRPWEWVRALAIPTHPVPLCSFPFLASRWFSPKGMAPKSGPDLQITNTQCWTPLPATVSPPQTAISVCTISKNPQVVQSARTPRRLQCSEEETSNSSHHGQHAQAQGTEGHMEFGTTMTVANQSSQPSSETTPCRGVRALPATCTQRRDVG